MTEHQAIRRFRDRLKRIGELLYAPLDESNAAPDDFTEYAIAMLHALSLAMPRGQQ